MLNFGALAALEASSPPLSDAFATRFRRERSPPLCINRFPAVRSMFRPIAAVIFCKNVTKQMHKERYFSKLGIAGVSFQDAYSFTERGSQGG